MSKHKNFKHISTKKLAYIGLDLAYKTDDLNIYNLATPKINKQLTDSGWEILTLLHVIMSALLNMVIKLSHL